MQFHNEYFSQSDKSLKTQFYTKPNETNERNEQLNQNLRWLFAKNFNRSFQRTDVLNNSTLFDSHYHAT